MRAHTSRHLTALVLALALGVAGCASGGGGSSNARPEGSTADRIGKAELTEAGNLDGLEAVQRLRRTWLRGRGGAMGSAPVVLYIDGTKRQSLDDLRIYRTTEIQRIDYMNSNDATTRYGTGHGGGAIVVTLVR